MNAPSSSTPVPPSSAHTTRPFKTEPFVAVPWERADLDSIVSRPFGIYLHVPFCTSRCGYCDFNTYALRTFPPGPAGDPIAHWAEQLTKELRLGAQILTDHNITPPAANTVFFGGGTPSLLGRQLPKILDVVRECFGIAPGAEITSEANPESTSPELFDCWRAGGVNRLSLGMQSSEPRVLALLDRQHDPARAVAAIEEAQAAGFEHLNLDLIYGTPGETTDDVARSVDTVLATGVDHVSAYALTIEPGTALFRKVAHGEIDPIDDDMQADRYYQIDAALQEAGFHWYEVSNWARQRDARCRHNLGYWEGGNWWSAGPGAHGYMGGVRWSIRKNPRSYGELLAQGIYPADWCEKLTPAEIREETIMLRLRVRDGLGREYLNPAQIRVADTAVMDGLAVWIGDRLVLTTRGRLLADGLIGDLLLAEE